MKPIMILIAAFCYTIAARGQEADKITDISDKRIPEDVRLKLESITSPEQLKSFNFTSKESVMSADTNKSGLLLTTKTSFSFSKGKIIGNITTIESGAGQHFIKANAYVELCYMYCCSDAKNVERCTKDLELFRQWEKDPGSCQNSRTTACL
ncbi:hypothetical protein [Taibaiella koreensis]|uniref:hypothetical protein n=1 Tax=Taibaiella koreensis TaxID=1268548 RepID=UPI0013C36121|nr:hypothetical protein [Taibaiella koreensis]